MNVDTVLKLLSVMTKDDRYKELLYQKCDGKGEVKTMCEVAERLHNKGRCEGKVEAKVESVLELLEEIGSVPETLCEKIQNEGDLEILSQWIKLAARANSLDEFIEKM